VIHPRCDLYLPLHWRIPGSPPAVALTYDDGPDPENTPRLLDLLAEAGAHATFFVVGDAVRRHPAILRRILDQGHAVGLHSDTHDRRFNLWSATRVAADLQRCQASIADAGGREPPILFRPPMGLKNPLVAAAVRRLGLRCVTWSAGGGDGATRSGDAVYARCAAGLRPGGIILLHDGSEAAHPQARPHAVPISRRLLAALTQRGLAACALRPGADGITAG
jgi:peptidoglycan/xylan/chitin deacetylase (PgdA/CDA1 family)